ncbi:MAG: NifU family protein [Anaerolineae bacterium]|nr:NifU family protein [Anaerolineae bacterium]MDW8099402.1 NifU family protein [Anaerolineae bacterium]
MSEAEQPVELTLEELIEQISRYLMAYHGGSVELVSYEDGEVRVKLGGHCLGCPYMQATLTLGIEKTVQHYFPEVRRVVAM